MCDAVAAACTCSQRRKPRDCTPPAPRSPVRLNYNIDTARQFDTRSDPIANCTAVPHRGDPAAKRAAATAAATGERHLNNIDGTGDRRTDEMTDVRAADVISVRSPFDWSMTAPIHSALPMIADDDARK
jgi:hypothetical protein